MDGEQKLVKGMTRRIVEIKQTNSNYFEKAVFYCRTNMPKSTSEYTLTQEAQRIIDRICSDTHIAPPSAHKRKIFNIIKTALLVIAGGIGAVLMFRLHF